MRLPAVCVDSLRHALRGLRREPVFASTVVLTLVLAACLIPARAATQVSPLESLRQE